MLIVYDNKEIRLEVVDLQYKDISKNEMVTTFANEEILFKLVQCDNYDEFKVKWKDEYKRITFYGYTLYDEILIRLTDKVII